MAFREAWLSRGRLHAPCRPRHIAGCCQYCSDFAQICRAPVVRAGVVIAFGGFCVTARPIQSRRSRRHRHRLRRRNPAPKPAVAPSPARDAVPAVVLDDKDVEGVMGHEIYSIAGEDMDGSSMSSSIIKEIFVPQSSTSGDFSVLAAERLPSIGTQSSLGRIGHSCRRLAIRFAWRRNIRRGNRLSF